MNEDKWYRNDQVWLAIVVVAIAVSMSLVFQKSRTIEKEEELSIPIASEPAIEKKELKFPTRDIPGVSDFKEVVRLPDSKIIWQNKGKIAGLNSKTIKYISKSSPKEAQIFFTDQLLDRYVIVRDSETTREDYGWNGVFLDPVSEEVIAVFSTSKSIGLPPGSPDNQTEISVMKVKK